LLEYQFNPNEIFEINNVYKNTIIKNKVNYNFKELFTKNKYLLLKRFLSYPISYKLKVSLQNNYKYINNYYLFLSKHNRGRCKNYIQLCINWYKFNKSKLVNNKNVLHKKLSHMRRKKIFFIKNYRSTLIHYHKKYLIQTRTLTTLLLKPTLGNIIYPPYKKTLFFMKKYKPANQTLLKNKKNKITVNH
jgi:hypothetical protein